MGDNKEIGKVNTWGEYFYNKEYEYDTPSKIGYHYYRSNLIDKRFLELEQDRLISILQLDVNEVFYDLAGCSSFYPNLMGPFFKYSIGVDLGQNKIEK